MSRHMESPPILISDGDKGGVGKSFLARVLTFLLSSSGRGWRGIDLDPRNGHLLRFHSTENVEQFDWTEPYEWNRAYDTILAADPSQFLLIDLPAQAGTVLAREYPRLLATAVTLKRPVIRFWSVAQAFDSVNLLAQTIHMVEARSTVAVMNLRNPDFDLWLKSSTRRQLLDGGGLELRLPELPTGVAAVIEESDLSFAEALSSLQQPYFKYDIEAYLASVQREFAPLLERLP